MKCPNGHEGAIILFSMFRCMYETCRYYDAKLTQDESDKSDNHMLSEDEIEEKRQFYRNLKRLRISGK